MNDTKLPAWEGMFWQDLLDEYAASPGYATGGPDEFFEEATGRSRFDNGNVIVGEIVEDEPLELTGAGA